jgi:hypothetical protein
VVHPKLNISATNDVVVVAQFVSPAAYGGNPPGLPPNVVNACIGSAHSSAGFVDAGAAAAGYSSLSRLHDYVFTFAAGTSVSEFSLRMADFGDYNPGMQPAIQRS